MMSNFLSELTSLLNRHCKENGSGTPDFILAEYLCGCLTQFNAAVNRREAWYGREQVTAHVVGHGRDTGMQIRWPTRWTCYTAGEARDIAAALVAAADCAEKESKETQ